MELKMYVIRDGQKIEEDGGQDDGEVGDVEDTGEDTGMVGAIGGDQVLIVVLNKILI